MKRICQKITGLLTVACMLFMVASCKEEPSAEYTKLKKANEQLTNELQNYEAVWNEIVNNTNIEAINESNFDKNIILVTEQEKIVGIKACRAYYNNYLKGFSNISFTIVDAFGQGDKVVKHWNFKGKHTGDFFGLPATGKEVDIDGVSLVKMKNGKIAQEQDFIANMDFMQQLRQIEE